MLGALLWFAFILFFTGDAIGDYREAHSAEFGALSAWTYRDTFQHIGGIGGLFFGFAPPVILLAYGLYLFCSAVGGFMHRFSSNSNDTECATSTVNEGHNLQSQITLQTSIGFKSVATVIMTMTTLWYVAIILAFREGKSFAAGLSDFWSTVCIGGPLLSFLLIPMFARIYVGERCPHRFVFWFALIFGLSPWLLFGFLALVSS